MLMSQEDDGSVVPGDQRDPFGRADVLKLPGGEAAAGDSSPISTAVELAAELRTWLREFERRSGRGMSRRRLAGALNVSVRSVYAYLSGTTLIPYEVLDRLLPLLEIPPEQAKVLRRARDRVEDARRRPAEPVVQALPPSPTAFTGRAGPLAELGQLEAGQRTAGAAAVCVLAGMAGVGKTALALAWAHEARARFPDGCLFVDLRGYDPDEPLDPHGALGVLLRSLGLADAELPPGVATRAIRYRTLAEGRRMLIVLDNAFSADQVRPLLPAAPSCFVVVTSRDDLAGLVARDGAHRIILPPLTWNEGLVLLEALLGANRVRAEEQPARALVKVCAGLPLALRLAAELAAARPGEPLAAIVDEIQEQRLPMLAAAGDERADVRAVLSWSYLRLAADYPGAAQAFRALGAFPCQDFDARSAAALLNTAPRDVVGLIDILVRGHLAERGPGRRFRMHDLLRAYAVELSAACDDDESRDAGFVRLAGYYALSAEEAASHLVPQARETSSGMDSSDAAAPVYLIQPAFADAGLARAWLDAERPNLVAVAVAAADRGLSGYASRLSAALDSYLDSAAHYHDAFTVHNCATSTPDVTARHAAQVRLATACFRLGRLDEALVHARQALAGARSAGDLQTQIGARLRLGTLHACLGQLKTAREQCEAALALARQAADRLAEERIIGNLAAIYAEQQYYRRALENGRRALALARELGDRVGEAHALCNVSRICQLAGRHQDAAAFGQKAQAAAAGIGDRSAQAIATAALAASCMQLGRYSEARGHFLEAIARAKDIGDRGLEITVLSGLHEVTQMLRLPQGSGPIAGLDRPPG
jgi:tetratricopeptide (TPR) repeat protein/transcriptional regulator with XRE-family HTH domain